MRKKEIDRIIALALREDAARKDITSRLLIPAGHVSQGRLIAKEEGILCGLDIAKTVFKRVDPRIRFKTKYKDGARIKRNTKVASVEGNTRSILTAERTALNFLGYLSGIATHTGRYVHKARRHRAKIYDTRKTTPGLRLLEKYAVACGGGHNHRRDLSEMVLIKDNHRNACPPDLTLTEAIKTVRRKTRKKIQVEVDNLKQFMGALSAFPDMILLDNMNSSRMKKAVRVVRSLPRKKRPLLEASGGITLTNVAKVAATGVDRISVGSLTHSHCSLDISLELK